MSIHTDQPTDRTEGPDPTTTTVAALTGATMLFLFGLEAGGWVLGVLAGVAGGSIALGAWPAVGLLVMTTLTALLVAFGWALAIRGASGFVRIVARDGFGRY